jgi:catechol 2,3-dioxygenase-like lactoylglutathione lyase family enzyme
MTSGTDTKTDPPYRTPTGLPPAPRIRGVHHTAWRCRDAAETRWFYETVCGLELEAALSFKEAPGSGLPLRYMHLFFKMGDGNFVAFFDIPDSAKEEYFKQRSGFNIHFAMEVETMAELEAFKKRWQDHGLEVYGPLDHHFVHSVYTYDPNGIQVEITCKTPIYDSYMADERAQNEQQMTTWQDETAEAKSGRLLRISPVAKGAMAAE